MHRRFLVLVAFLAAPLFYSELNFRNKPTLFIVFSCQVSSTSITLNDEVAICKYRISNYASNRLGEHRLQSVIFPCTTRFNPVP